MALYLVTGGCGFIGSHLASSLLAAGHSVRILDDLSSGRRALAPAAADLHIGSITDPKAVATAIDGVDGCFHLAAIASVIRSVEDWSGTHGVNLGGTIRVFEAAAAAGVPVVYASSAAAYGEPAVLPIDEDSQTRPLTAYGADKLGCEIQAKVGGATRGLKSFGLRFFNVYGPNQDPSSPYSGVIAIFADRVRAGLPIVIYGDGKQTRDFVYVSDVVRYLAAALRLASPEAPICNVCRGQPVTVRELAEAIMEVCGRQVLVDHEKARPGEIRHSLGSTARAEELFEFSAQVRLVDGLRLLLRAMPEQ